MGVGVGAGVGASTPEYIPSGGLITYMCDTY